MKYFIILLFVLSVVSNAHAELSMKNYGHIEGVVLDAKSQQPLIGVNIIIDGSPRLNWQFISSLPSRFPHKAGIYTGYVF